MKKYYIYNDEIKIKISESIVHCIYIIIISYHTYVIPSHIIYKYLNTIYYITTVPSSTAAVSLHRTSDISFSSAILVSLLFVCQMLV